MSDLTSPTAIDAANDNNSNNNNAAAADVSSQVKSPSGGAGAAGAAAAAPDPSDPNAQISIRALVSTKEAGVIIGKGGANVAHLREQTGVKAGVSKVVQGVHDRVLSVSGTLDGISRVRAGWGLTAACTVSEF